jgi:hypothetical protein
VSPKKALARALEHLGGEGRKLVADWDHVEKELSEKLMGPYREYLQAKLEVGQLITALDKLDARQGR